MKNKILLFFLISLPWLAQAQKSDWNFINFSSKDGVSSNTINAIIKDRLGYMWYATEDGLNRFDGISFSVYRHNAADTSSIKANQILALYEDPSGNLWIGSNRGLSLYDRKQDAFHNYEVTKGSAARSICSDGAGGLWIGSYSGLFEFNPSTGISKCYTSKNGTNGHLISNTITCVFQDSRHRKWAGTDLGLQLYQPATDNFRLFAKTNSDSSISDNSIKSIAEDKQGNLLVGTSDGGLNILLPDGNSFKSFKSIDNQPNTLSSNRIYSIAQESNGKIWLGTENGLNIFDPKTASVQRVNEDVRYRYGLKGKSVRCIYIDKNGIYWIGTYQSGINKYDRNLTFFNLIQSSQLDPMGLSAPKVTSFAEAESGNLYIGTDGGGLNLYNPNSGLFQHISIDASSSKPLSVMALEPVGNELWIGTYMRGIYVLNTKSGAIKHYTKEDGNSGLSSDDIFCIKKDKTGNIWIGTNGKGVDLYSANTGKFQPFISYLPESKPLISSYIRSIETDSLGNVWIGTLGNGLAVFNQASKYFKIYTPINTGLPLDDAQTLLPLNNGIVWVGTRGNGLCRIDYKNNNFTNLAETQGLANTMIYRILEDNGGKIWISTNKGISFYDPTKKAFKNFTTNNGLQGNSFNLGSGLKTTNGKLYFGGLEGFNYFMPSALNYDKNVPTVVFTDLKVDYQRVQPGQNAAIQEDISVAKEIHLNYKQSFSIEFAALDYTISNECQYQYKLEGFDKSWNIIGDARSAVFTNLDPGKYTLKVKAFNPNSSWTTEAAIITIYIKPPFWLTPFAYFLYFAFIGGVLWAARSRAIKKLHKKFADEQERQKVKQLLEDERREAERQRAFDQVKIKFLTNLSHEFRTPISLIVGPVETLLNQEKNQEKIDQLSMVKRNARRLLNLVNQLLDFRKLEEKEVILNTTEDDFIAFVKEVAESFRDFADRRHIKFIFLSHIDSYYTAFDKDKIERILFNLLSNAFKFTGQDGQITLEVHKVVSKNEIVLSVADTGIGMTQEEQDKIFDQFFQAKSHASIMNQGTGIGLSITKEFVRLHEGLISVESTYGKGSIFNVSLPLAPINKPVITTQEDQSEANETVNLEVVTINESEKEEATIGDQHTLLIVEDNDDFRSYLKDSLKPFYKVIEAADGKDGWNKVLSSHPHVIVSDISMPYMDGIELSNKIKADKRTCHIPIILLTALTGHDDQLKGLKTGASDYLTKPFNAEILRFKINNLIQLNQSLKETYSRRVNVETAPVVMQSENEKLLLKITQYIEENIDNDKLSVEELSKHVFMSRGTLYNKLLDLTGETPVEFIRSVKLNKAAALLENTDMKMAQIAYTVGFSTANYFTRAFKAKFNMLPTEYAEAKKKGSKVES